MLHAREDCAPIQEVTTNGTTRLIPAEEPVFLIRGQDVVGGDAVRAWADLAEASGAEPRILAVAREHAAKMDAWPKKKVADLPAASTPGHGEAAPEGRVELANRKAPSPRDGERLDLAGGYFLDYRPSFQRTLWHLVTPSGDLLSALSMELEKARAFAAALARPAPGGAVADLRPGLERALRILRHPNAGMEPPDGGSPSQTDRVRNVADEIEELLAASPAPPAAPVGSPVEIDYTNHRGERSTRTVIPTGRLLPGDATYHPTAGWVIEAWDVAKGAMRTFDPAHVHAWGEQRPQSSAAVFRASLAAAKATVAEAGLDLEPRADVAPKPDATEVYRLRTLMLSAHRKIIRHGWTFDGSDEAHATAEKLDAEYAARWRDFAAYVGLLHVIKDEEVDAPDFAPAQAGAAPTVGEVERLSGLKAVLQDALVSDGDAERILAAVRRLIDPGQDVVALVDTALNASADLEAARCRSYTLHDYASRVSEAKEARDAAREALLAAIAHRSGDGAGVGLPEVEQIAEPTLADMNDAFSMIAGMEKADQGSSVRLIRLVDGDETWEGRVGKQRQEFAFRDDAADWVADLRREARGRALARVVLALRARLAPAVRPAAPGSADLAGAVRAYAVRRRELDAAINAVWRLEGGGEQSSDRSLAEAQIDEEEAWRAVDAALGREGDGWRGIATLREDDGPIWLGWDGTTNGEVPNARDQDTAGEFIADRVIAALKSHPSWRPTHWRPRQPKPAPPHAGQGRGGDGSATSFPGGEDRA